MFLTLINQLITAMALWSVEAGAVDAAFSNANCSFPPRTHLISILSRLR